jgi:transposase
MAPSTRQNAQITPPPGPSEGREADTIKKTRFYNIWDREHLKKSTRQICIETGTAEPTGRRWLNKHKDMGSLAYRKSRRRSSKLGRPSKVTKSMCKMLVSPSKNPVRNRTLDYQLEFHNIPVQKRQLRRKLKEHTQGGGIYKCAFVKKEISNKNCQERVAYGEEHKDKSIEDFWSYIFFTDKAHIDPTSLYQQGVLREHGYRYDDENIQQRPKKKGIRFHIAAWITW